MKTFALALALAAGVTAQDDMVGCFDGGAEMSDKMCETDDFMMCAHMMLAGGSNCAVAWFFDMAMSWESEEMSAEMKKIMYYPEGDAKGSGDEEAAEEDVEEEEGDDFSDFHVDFLGRLDRHHFKPSMMWRHFHGIIDDERDEPVDFDFEERFNARMMPAGRDAHITEENFEDYCAVEEDASTYESGTRLTVGEDMCGNGV